MGIMSYIGGFFSQEELAIGDHVIDWVEYEERAADYHYVRQPLRDLYNDLHPGRRLASGDWNRPDKRPRVSVRTKLGSQADEPTEQPENIDIADRAGIDDEETHQKRHYGDLVFSRRNIGLVLNFCEGLGETKSYFDKQKDSLKNQIDTLDNLGDVQDKIEDFGIESDIPTDDDGDVDREDAQEYLEDSGLSDVLYVEDNKFRVRAIEDLKEASWKYGKFVLGDEPPKEPLEVLESFIQTVVDAADKIEGARHTYLEEIYPASQVDSMTYPQFVKLLKRTEEYWDNHTVESDNGRTGFLNEDDLRCAENGIFSHRGSILDGGIYNRFKQGRKAKRIEDFKEDAELESLAAAPNKILKNIVAGVVVQEFVDNLATVHERLQNVDDFSTWNEAHS